MKTPIPQRKGLNGFSLVEMAIVILIAGIMMGAGLSLLAVKQAAAQADVTQKHQETIKQALINYLGKNKRLPCPATVNASNTPPYTGLEDTVTSATPSPCTNYSGIVPYQTLGLERSVALDGWENFIAYVVTPPTIALPPAPPRYTTSWIYAYGASVTSTTTSNISAAFWPAISTGGIKVLQTTDTSTTPIPHPIADPALATGAAVVLISYGKNGLGAINIKGGQNLPLPLGTDEQQNADPTKLVSGSPPAVIAVKRDTTDSTAGGGAFDDVVMILSADDLTSPLISNGTLQSSGAQAALNQANDIILGSIVATKNACPGTATPPVCTGASNYYYTIPSLVFPTNVTAWGINCCTSIYIDGQFPNAATTAYSITASDGSQRIVSVYELRGILSRGAGF